MCEQFKVLEKIHEEGKMNGYAVELAEAQAMDYERMNKRMTRMEKDINHMKKDFAASLKEQARQGGMIEAIFNQINGPAEEERKNGIVWSEIKNIVKTPTGKMIIILAIGCLCFTGQRIMELFHLI